MAQDKILGHTADIVYLLLLPVKRLIALTISTCKIEAKERPATISHCVAFNNVSWNIPCNAGINRIQDISRSDTPKETNSHGLMPSARIQMGSVLERWLNALSICEKANTQKAIV